MRAKSEVAGVNTSPSFHPHSGFVNGSSSTAYSDRREAGRVLAQRLLRESPFADPLLLALPRGGVPVACEIAKSLLIPIDIFLVRKFALSQQPEIALGTVASGGIEIFDTENPSQFSEREIQAAIEREQAELARRERSYRQSRAPQSIEGRCAIVVDDGLTTGYTMRMAIRALRRLHPASIIAAIPVASAEACEALKSEADLVVCARIPETFFSVRRWYRDFSPVLDEDIRTQLASLALEASPKAFRA